MAHEAGNQVPALEQVRRYCEMTLTSISVERQGMAQDVLAILDGKVQ